MDEIRTAIIAILPIVLSANGGNTEWLVRRELLLTYVFILAVSLVAGISKYIDLVQRHQARPGIRTVAATLFSSCVSGMAALFVCLWLELNAFLSLLIILVAAHGGKQTLKTAERVLNRIINRRGRL